MKGKEKIKVYKVTKKTKRDQNERQLKQRQGFKTKPKKKAVNRKEKEN